MKIVIIGGTGLLGSNLIRLYTHLEHDVIGFSRTSPTSLNNKIDFTQLKPTLDEYCSTHKPDIIVNAVALVNLEQCEKEPPLCTQVNLNIANTLAHIAKRHNCYFIHISTDHFYQDSTVKHTEHDPITLLNNYAKSKYEAEQSVLNLYPTALIVRTNIIGFRASSTPSFFEWLVDALEKRTELNLFTDFSTSPISVQELGSLLLKCYDKRLNGIYNIASSEQINKYGFGIKVAKVFHLSDEHINKYSLKEFQKSSTLKRASTLGLDVTKIENALDLKMPSIETTIKQLLLEYTGERHNDK